jgi:predicted membrane protein (TIGR00267 family)
MDPHQREGSVLSDVILGGQDGLVNVLGVILGVAAATGDPRVVIIAGLAATFAESVSMGAVAFTSTLADADYYDSEKEREFRHVEQAPELERDEIQSIYAQKGFEGDLLERIVGVSAIVGSLIPLVPFAFLPIVLSMWTSVFITALVLFVVGIYKARVTVGRPLRSGLEMAVIGTISALIGYAVGALLKISPAP